mmetsp:Transcript_108194/g.186770  ORF Transcript_108194/g.186770 Transcript_108194/m.186770 type:complete len:310 (+) Transcript_108194:3599-4528(+)
MDGHSEVHEVEGHGRGELQPGGALDVDRALDRDPPQALKVVADGVLISRPDLTRRNHRGSVSRNHTWEDGAALLGPQVCTRLRPCADAGPPVPLREPGRALQGQRERLEVGGLAGRNGPRGDPPEGHCLAALPLEIVAQGVLPNKACREGEARVRGLHKDVVADGCGLWRGGGGDREEEPLTGRPGAQRNGVGVQAQPDAEDAQREHVAGLRRTGVRVVHPRAAHQQRISYLDVPVAAPLVADGVAPGGQLGGVVDDGVPATLVDRVVRDGGPRPRGVGALIDMGIEVIPVGRGQVDPIQLEVECVPGP